MTNDKENGGIKMCVKRKAEEEDEEKIENETRAVRTQSYHPSLHAQLSVVRNAAQVRRVEEKVEERKERR